MKKSKIIAIVASVSIAIILIVAIGVGLYTQMHSPDIDYGTSSIYTEDDIQAAFNAVDAKLEEWDAVLSMEMFNYTDDEEITMRTRYYENLDFTYDEYIVIETEFWTNGKESPFETYSYYFDYSWQLGRRTDGEWEIITHGVSQLYVDANELF